MGPGTKTVLIVASGFAWTLGMGLVLVALSGGAPSHRAKLAGSVATVAGSIATTYFIVKA